MSRSGGMGLPGQVHPIFQKKHKGLGFMDSRRAIRLKGASWRRPPARLASRCRQTHRPQELRRGTQCETDCFWDVEGPQTLDLINLVAEFISIKFRTLAVLITRDHLIPRSSKRRYSATK